MQDRVLVHHLSDIHFGRFSNWPIGDNRPSSAMDRALATSYPHQYLHYLAHLADDAKPDLIIVSGDMASIGSQDELDQAAEFCRQIAGHVRPNGHKEGAGHYDTRLLVVPGNHDVDWSMTGTHRYLSFHHAFRGFPFPGRHNGREAKSLYVNESLGVLILALDSTKYGGTTDAELQPLKQALAQHLHSGQKEALIPIFEKIERIDPGVIEAEDLTAFEEDYRALEQQYGSRLSHFVKIAVLHHPVCLFPSDQTRKYPVALNSGLLKESLQSRGFDLVLHGHLHTPRVLYEDLLPQGHHQGLHIVAAGSLAGEGRENSFNAIDIKRRNGGQFICRVDRVASESSQRFEVKGTIGKIYRHDENVERLPKDFFEVIANDGDFESLHRDLTRLLARARRNTGYADVWLLKYEAYLRNANVIYATDIQATDAWTTPIVYHYFLHQVKHLIVRRAACNQSPYHVSQPVFKAMQQAARNASRHFATPGDAKSVFSRHIHAVQHAETGIELVRILIWDADELAHPEVDAIFRLHETCEIPLFFIDARNVDRRKFRPVEYVAFPRTPATREDTHGFYFNTEDSQQKHDHPLLFGDVLNVGNVMDDFMMLLAVDSIMLAADALEIHRRRSGSQDAKV